MATTRHGALPETLPRAFYERRVDVVARALLGCYLVRGSGRNLVGGRIVETEAYGGPGDPGSHADRAPNGRARIMFGRAGIAYVYFTYGMHHCLNAVTGADGDASAVLIRAIEPKWGIERMREGAPASLPDARLGWGPGRVCRALAVDRRFNGADLTKGPVRILAGPTKRMRAHSGSRIGLSRDDDRPWRYWVGGSPVGAASISRSRRVARGS